MSRPPGVWPSRDDYQNAVRYPQRNLTDSRLHDAEVEMRSLGILQVPFARSGNFGAVYRFKKGRQAYAVKVFDKAQPDRQLRYRLIHQQLASQTSSPHLVSFSYDDQGILVNGHRYPTLVMDWADGELLDRYLEDELDRTGYVDNGRLCRAWADVVLDLKHRQVAHGDLQHGNILVKAGGQLALVDYDGMFVPAMQQQGLTAAEIGMPAYQHPKRYRGYFDHRLDDFAALVILLCLAAVDARRWQRYHTDDNCLIVREADLLAPDQSDLLNDLSRVSDPPLRKLAVLLKAAARGELDAIPPFGEVVADGTIKHALRPTRPSQPTGPRTPKPRPSHGERQPLQDVLTRPEQRVLGFLVQGYSDVEIARALAVDEKLVRQHIGAIARKTGSFERRGIVEWAMQQKGSAQRRPATPPPPPSGPSTSAARSSPPPVASQPSTRQPPPITNAAEATTVWKALADVIAALVALSFFGLSLFLLVSVAMSSGIELGEIGGGLAFFVGICLLSGFLSALGGVLGTLRRLLERLFT